MIETARWLDETHTQVTALVDGRQMQIPADMDNRHYRDLVASGTSVADYVTPQPSQDDYANAISAHITAAAKGRGYDSEDRLASYALSANPAWQAEAKAFIFWRDAVWTYTFQQLAAVISGQRQQPGIEDMIKELPAIVWPSP